MQKREKILAIATAVVVGVIGLDYAREAVLGGSSSSVDVVREQYEATVENVREAPDIYREFYALVGKDFRPSDERREGYAADLQFQDDVARWCQSVGFPRPRFSMTVEDIRGTDNRIVMEYQLVVMTISLPRGEIERFAQLLKLFEENGLILQYVNFQSSGRRNEVLGIEITVARLVEAFKETTARRNLRST